MYSNKLQRIFKNLNNNKFYINLKIPGHHFFFIFRVQIMYDDLINRL